jgi:hypothetical protein
LKVVSYLSTSITRHGAPGNHSPGNLKEYYNTDKMSIT